jgi:hypothetical protein
LGIRIIVIISTTFIEEEQPMKNPQTIFHKDGVWITEKKNAVKVIREAKTALRLAEVNLDAFGLRGMGVLPNVQDYRSLSIKMAQLREAIDEYETELLRMYIRDGIPDPSETSFPIPEIAD